MRTIRFFHLSGSYQEAIRKLSVGVFVAEAIMLQMFRTPVDTNTIIRLLDMDDMQMHGMRIVSAYHDWAKNSYDKLLKGIEDRDSNLQQFIMKVKVGAQ
jgi:hypothetical protein